MELSAAIALQRLVSRWPRRFGPSWQRLTKDSVASKLLAVYSRGYARDYLDAHSIITSHRFTHQQLITLCQRRDPTLDLPTFAAAIARHRTLPTTEFTKYGLHLGELPALSTTLLDFAKTIQKTSHNPGATHVDAANPAGPSNPKPGLELL